MHRHLLLAVDEESHHLGYHRRRRPHQRRILHGRIKGGISDGFAGARTLAIGGRPLAGAGSGPRWRFAVAAGAARRQHPQGAEQPPRLFLPPAAAACPLGVLPPRAAGKAAAVALRRTSDTETVRASRTSVETVRAMVLGKDKVVPFAQRPFTFTLIK